MNNVRDTPQLTPKFTPGLVLAPNWILTLPHESHK